jgi:hypothetical protein
MSKLGPYSKEIQLGLVDGRTREGRLLAQMRRVLIEQVGGDPTPPQRILIERAAYLQLRCAKLDSRLIDGTFTQYDNASYIAFCNALRRALVSLGLVDPNPELIKEKSQTEDPLAAIRAHVASRQIEVA